MMTKLNRDYFLDEKAKTIWYTKPGVEYHGSEYIGTSDHLNPRVAAGMITKKRRLTGYKVREHSGG
jgi:hypothetical protein